MCLSESSICGAPGRPPTGTGADGYWVWDADATCTWTWVRAGNTPIIVDVRDQGFHLTSAKDGVSFDIEATGTPIKIAWTDQSYANAFLALDRNRNGKIDNGEELFGNVTEQPPSNDPNGYRALAVFDTNGDGVIDDKDPIWRSLLLWIDLNHDGISQPDELFSLPSLGVTSLSLEYTEDDKTDQYGNRFRYRSHAAGKGVDHTTYDVIFATP